LEYSSNSQSHVDFLLGYNTQYIRAFLPQILNEFSSDSLSGVVLMLGTNDSAIPSSIQHVSLIDYVTNLEWILNYLIIDFKINKEKIIIVAPPKIDDSRWKEEEDKLNENSKLLDKLVAEYAKECSQFCAKNNFNCVNLYEIMSNEGDSFRELFYDGLHLSGKGGLLLFNSLKPFVEKFISKDLNENFPDWKQLTSNYTTHSVNPE